MKSTTRYLKNTQILAGSIAALLLATHSAQALSDSWNVNASGDWATASNWLGGQVPGSTSDTTNADVATFSTTLTLANKAITVDANRNIWGISFVNTSAFGFTLTGGNLLLSNAGVIQSLATDAAHMDTVASAIAIQGNGGSANFTALATSASNLLNIAGTVTGVSTAGNSTTLNLNGTNTGGNVITGIIGDGSLGGKLALTKSDAGTWQLNGANTYTGTTTLTAGRLIANNASALGVGGDITFGGATLQFTSLSAGQDWGARFKNTTAGGILLDTAGNNLTMAGVIDATNTAGLNKSGVGTLSLSGTNTYTGTNTLTAGVLEANNTSALSSGNITFAGGRLRYTTATAATDWSTRFVNSTSGAIFLDTNSQNLTFAGVIAASNTQGLNKLGAGNLTLAGNISNLYTGNTVVSGGSLILDNTGIGNNNADRISNASALVLDNGSFIYKGSDSADSTETIAAISGGGGKSTLTVTYGGTQVATLTAASIAHSTGGNGTILVNGTNLGKNNTDVASIGRLLLTTAPSGTAFVGTSNALTTGINAGVTDTKIVPFLVGEATATTGGLGTATGVANTFVTYVAGSGLRPLNPTDEFVNNALTTTKNTYITSTTSSATAGSINSLVINGGNLQLNNAQTVTIASGAVLFASSNTIGGGTLVFTPSVNEALITVNAGVTANIASKISAPPFGGDPNNSPNSTSLVKSGAGNLILSNPANDLTGGRLVVDGGGTVTISGFTNVKVTPGNGQSVNTLIGAFSANNIVNVTGRLDGATVQLGGGNRNGDNSYGYGGGNQLNLLGPGNDTTYTMNGSGSNVSWQIGGRSSNNSLNVGPGASLQTNRGNGSNIFNVGENAGSNNNSVTVSGPNARWNSSNGNQIGLGGNGNSLTISNGGQARHEKTLVGVGANSSGNSVNVDGLNSFLSVSNGNNGQFTLASGAGASNNSVTIQNGATADLRWTRQSFTGAIGSQNNNNDNYMRVKDPGTYVEYGNTNLTLTIGGSEGTANVLVDTNASGNHFDLYSGAAIRFNVPVHLMGVNSAFNLGDGTGITSTQGLSTAQVGATGSYISGVYLANADSRLNLNNGRLVAGAAGALVSGLGQLQINGDAYISTTQTGGNASTISSVIAGTTGALIKEGSGTLILQATNTYTGGTVVKAGTLALAYTSAGERLADSGVLTLNGGTVDLTNGAVTEVIASTTLAAGRSGVTRSGGSSTLRMNTITPGVGIVNFGTASIADTDNLNTNGILGAWATVGGTGWAVNSTNLPDGAITAYTAYTDSDALGSVIVDNSATNVRLNTALGSGNLILGAAVTTINTLLQSSLGAATVETLGSTLATDGVMIATAMESVTIGVSPGDGILQTATPGANLVLNNLNSVGFVALTINAPILANGDSGLTTAGKVILNGVNTFTGKIGVGGTLTIGGDGQLNSGNYSGAISMSTGGSLILATTANQILGGVISGDGGFTQSGTGTTTLNGANNYAGTTTISDGVLVAGSPTAFGAASTASLALSINAKVQTNGNSITIRSLSGTSSDTIIESGSAVAGTDTLTLDAMRSVLGVAPSMSYLGKLQDGSTRALALVKNGIGTLTLSGNSSYTGGTTLNGGTLTIGAQSALGTGTLTLKEGTIFQQAAFEGNAVGGALPFSINLAGGQSFINLPATFKDIWLSNNVSGPGTMKLISDSTGRTLTLSGAKTFTGGIIQSSQSLPGTGTGSTQYPNVAIDDVGSLGTGTFYAQITGTSTSVGWLRSLTDLSAGAGVANNIEIAVSSRLLLDGSNPLKLSGAISGSGDLRKLSSATLTLAGNSTYTGSTFLSGGTLSVSADANLGGPNALVFDGGTFQVTGTTMQNFGIHTPTVTAGKTVAIDVANAAHTFTVSQVLNQTGQLTKTGDGTLALSNSNTYTGKTNVNGGVLLLNSAGAVPGGIGTSGGTSAIVFSGGVIGLGNGDFNRNLDFITLANSANFTGAGGWAAYTADRTVNLGGAGFTIIWQDGETGFNNQTLILGASTADKTVTLVNPLDLGNFARTLRVDNGTAANDAILSGALSSTGASLTKTGTGTVQLNGLQAYDELIASAGTTNVNGLLGTAPGAAVVTVGDGANLKFGSISQTLASLDIGAGSTVTFTGGSASGAFTSSGGGSKAPSFGAAVVPEPGTFGLLLVGALGMLNRRRRQA